MSSRTLQSACSISIVVPVYNEAATIQQLQNQLRPLQGQCEILFVDGGSTDDTRLLIDPAFRLITSAKGRAQQMNAGAQASAGDVLFFLHSDSVLPRDPLGEINRVMKTHRWGCFGVAFPSRNPVMFACRLVSNHRCRFRRIVFGDQGIFIERALFFQVGMFPDLPIMEDYQLSLTLRDLGVRPGITRHRMVTSDRRFPAGTLRKLAVMRQMVQLRKLYRAGVPADEIARRYADVR